MVKLVVKFPSNPPNLKGFGKSIIIVNIYHLGNTSCEVRSLLQDIDLLRNLLNKLSLLQFNLLFLCYSVSTLRTDCGKVHLSEGELVQLILPS